MATRAVPAPVAQIPNALTVARLVVIPVFVALVLTCDGGRSWPAAILFGAAAVTDQIDGWLARVWHVESGFGKVADPLADRLLIDAAVEAAAEAGIEIVLLLSAYGRGGLERFRQESPAEYLEQLEAVRTTGVRVGLAPHSVRACPREWLEELGRYASSDGLPLHVHADEQPREVEECLAEHGLRPIELLAETGCLGPHTTVVHATHADARELDLLAESGARVCVCPTTEANLGDGFAPTEEICERGIGICIGSDSNVRIDPLEELRELEGTARRRAGRRNVLSVSTLLCCGADEGAAALGLERWPDVEVDLEHPSLADVEPGDVHAALVFGCGADVFA